MAMKIWRRLGIGWVAWLAVVVLALALFAPRPCAAQDVVPKGRVYTLPMDYQPLRIPFPILHVRINGSEPLPFLLDTGCSTAIVVTEFTQKQMHLNMSSDRTRDSLHSDVSYKEARLASAKLCAANSINDIELTSNDNSGIRALILPSKVGQMLENFKIAGLIGLPVLKPFSVARLDFARNVLVLGLFGDLADLVKDSAELTTTPSVDGRLHVTARVGSDGKADMVVDTGSPSTLLADDLAYLAGFTLTDTSTYTNVAGPRQVYSGILARIDLGSFTETNVDCEIPLSDANLLGADLLSRYLVTLDFGNNKMYLTRSSDYTERIRSRGANSIVLVLNDGRLRVASIRAGSSAAQAGVKKGDELTAVNGVSVQEMPVNSACLLLEGYVGDRVTLDLLRKGEVAHATYDVDSMATGADEGARVKITLRWGGKLVLPDSAGVPGGGQTKIVEPGETVTIGSGTTVIANPR